jgi:hypothetical protein
MPTVTAPSKNIFTSQPARKGKNMLRMRKDSTRNHPQSERHAPTLGDDLRLPCTTVHQTAPPVIFHSSWLLRRSEKKDAEPRMRQFHTERS